MDCSIPAFPVLHYLPEFAQTHVHWISDVIQPSHPWVCSNSCPLNQWCHPTISSPVNPSSSCPQSFPVSGSFLKSQLFTSGGQSIGASASASVLPGNIQSWFPFVVLLSGWSTGKFWTQWHSALKTLIKPCGSLPSILGVSSAVSRVVKSNFLLTKHWCILPNRLHLIITVKVESHSVVTDSFK